MQFLTANIDRAILMTQYDLRGFWHPLGFRIEERHPKFLDATTGNFMVFAAGASNTSDTIDEGYAPYFDSSFEEYLAMCRDLAACCYEFEKEAIRLIIAEILKQHEEMTAEVAAGTMEQTSYLMPLSKDNRWGKAILALQEAFSQSL